MTAVAGVLLAAMLGGVIWLGVALVLWKLVKL